MLRPGSPMAQGFSLARRVALFFVLVLAALSAPGQKLQLQIEPEWQGAPLALFRTLPAKAADFSVSRLDGLLSELALQRTNGSWLKSDGWYVFFSAEQGRLSAV